MAKGKNNSHNVWNSRRKLQKTDEISKRGDLWHSDSQKLNVRDLNLHFCISPVTDPGTFLSTMLWSKAMGSREDLYQYVPYFRVFQWMWNFNLQTTRTTSCKWSNHPLFYKEG